MAEQFIQTPMALYHFSLLSWARIFWGMAGIVCWRWAGAKKKTRGFGKTNLIPAFVVQSLSADHKSTPFKIERLMPLFPW